MRRAITALTLLAALLVAACGPNLDHGGPLIAAGGEEAPQQAPLQQAAPPQAAPNQAQQADSGPGWGGAIAAGALGYMLGSSSSSAPSRVIEREVRYVDRPVPAPSAPAVPKVGTPPAASQAPSVRRLPGAGSFRPSRSFSVGRRR